MQNNHYMQYLVGNVRFYFRSQLVRRSGFVREGGLLAMQMAMVGNPGAVKIPNPRRMEKYAVVVVKTPYDVAGTALMIWRYLDPNKQDNNRYYNYGTQYLWIEAETYACSYKVIHDRAGNYWKTLFIAGVPCESDDKSMRFLTRTSQQMIDDRADRSGLIQDCTPRNPWTFFAELDVNSFSLAGFQNLCK